MITLCIIPCGSRKIWDVNPFAGPTMARSVYVGPFAKKCMEYATTFYPDSWCILSAKYGFLLPDDTVPESYNVSFNDKKTNPIGVRELSPQVTAKRLDQYKRIIVLGGKNYSGMARAVFAPAEILTPLSDCKGIGYMMGKLKRSIDSGVPL